MQETWVRSLDQEDPLEKEMATRSRVLASEIQQTEEYSGLQSTVSEESDMTQRLNYHTDRHSRSERLFSFLKQTDNIKTKKDTENWINRFITII